MNRSSAIRMTVHSPTSFPFSSQNGVYRTCPISSCMSFAKIRSTAFTTSGPLNAKLAQRRDVPDSDVVADRVVLGHGIAEVLGPVPAFTV